MILITNKIVTTRFILVSLFKLSIKSTCLVAHTFKTLNSSLKLNESTIDYLVFKYVVLDLNGFLFNVASG